jgi:flavin reductase (DIM6/NTAB) family NADH-FMN oxidoreductase RutF
MFRNVNAKELDLNPFQTIGQDWMLVTAGTKENCNTLTASWGGLGTLWYKDVATIYIRPQRYTKQFIDNSDYFTLSFFGKGYRDELNLCGTKSGRDMDKIKACGFTVAESACGAPYFAQAELVIVCRKLYSDTIKPERFLDAALDLRCYPKGDHHTFYIGEVVETLKKED